MRRFIHTMTDSEFSRRAEIAATQTIPIVMVVGAKVQSGLAKQEDPL